MRDKKPNIEIIKVEKIHKSDEIKHNSQQSLQFSQRPVFKKVPESKSEIQEQVNCLYDIPKPITSPDMSMQHRLVSRSPIRGPLTNNNIKEDNKHSKEQIQNLYQNLLDSFQEGILLINHQEQILYQNNKFLKLLRCKGNASLVSELKQAIIKSKVLTEFKGSNQHQSKKFQDVIKLAQLSNRVNDVLEKLLYCCTSSNSYDSHQNSPILNSSRSNSMYSQDQSRFQLPYVTLEYTLSEEPQKLIKIKIIQNYMAEDLQDMLILSNRNIRFESSKDDKPILLLVLKDITSKSKLKNLRSEYQFQNSLLTPLNCSIQMLSIIQELVKDSSILTQYAKQALGSNQLLLHQINDILDFAAIECNTFCYKWNIVNIKSIVEEVVTIYQESCHEKQINFKVKVEENLNEYQIRTDKGRILQVLVNLMNNSIKFTKPQGSITLKVQLLNTEICGTLIKIQVKDTGVGVRKEKLQMLKKSMKQNFGMVQTLLKSNQNLGLGINISSKIVQGLASHNEFGQKNLLDIQSKEQKGTKISFIISHHPHEAQKELFSVNNPMSQTIQTKKSKFMYQVSENINEEESKMQEEDYKPEPQNLLEAQESQEWILLNSQSQINHSIQVPQFPNTLIQSRSRKLIKMNIQQSSRAGQFTPSLYNMDINSSLNINQRIKPCHQCVNLLYVDDVPFNHIALKAMLKMINVELLSAYDGYQAIQLVKDKLFTHCKTYQLILMDIQMPGIDGFQTSTEILSILDQNNIATNIVMCSAFDSEDNYEKAKSCGMVDVLPKPIPKQELRRVIDKYFEI